MINDYDPYFIIEHKRCRSVIAIKIRELLMLLGFRQISKWKYQGYRNNRYNYTVYE